jgi:hypothetical protein
VAGGYLRQPLICYIPVAGVNCRPPVGNFDLPLVRNPAVVNPLPVPRDAWEDVTMDFIEGLPKSQGFSVIMIVVDTFTKYSDFIPLKHPYIAATMAQLFLHNIVKLHSMPYTITSDRDAVFTSKFRKELFTLWGSKLQMSIARHPQTDGQTERVNQCIEMYLRSSVNDTPTKWADWLPLAAFWYNSTYHCSLGCSPSKALYGHETHFGKLPRAKEATNPDLHSWLQERHAYSKHPQYQLQSA